MLYNRRRRTLENLMKLPDEVDTWQVTCALRCSRNTVMSWFFRWRKRGIFWEMVSARDGSFFIRRDRLLIYLISTGRVKIPPQINDFPSKEDAKVILSRLADGGEVPPIEGKTRARALRLLASQDVKIPRP